MGNLLPLSCFAVNGEGILVSDSNLHGAASKTNLISAVRTSKLKYVFVDLY